MGVETSIEWCDHTFNPWIGCTKVSPGCKNCYAEAYDRRVGGVPVGQRDPNKGGKAELRWGPGARRTRTTSNYWRQPVAWNATAVAAGRRRRVFCASLADVFDAEVPPEWRKDLFRLIRETPALDWLLLTKRPQNIQSLWPFNPELSERSWPNVWIGTTVENQEQANARIPHIAYLDATVKFLSCEPLLERLDLSQWLDEDHTGFVPLIDWIIIGGESGASARPFATDWAVSLIDQARNGGRAEAAPFVKQLGSRPVDAVGAAIRLTDRAGGDPGEWPIGLCVREYPRGNVL